MLSNSASTRLSGFIEKKLSSWVWSRPNRLVYIDCELGGVTAAANSVKTLAVCIYK